MTCVADPLPTRTPGTALVASVTCSVLADPRAPLARAPTIVHPLASATYFSVFSRRRRMVERTVTAAEVFSMYARRPP